MTGMGRILKIVSTELLKNSATTTMSTPNMINAPPVLAPKRTCPAMPPAPWHIGTAPIMGPSRFSMPVEIATFSCVTGRSGNKRLFSSVTAMTALPSVSGTCGNGLASSGSVSLAGGSTLALNAGDVIYVSSATADALQTWYTITITYTAD